MQKLFGTHTLLWWEISLIKVATAASILAAAKLWTPLIALDWYWYASIAVVAAIRPTLTFFRKA